MAKQDDTPKIISEVVDKFESYQTRNAGFMRDYNEWSDMFTVKKPKRKSNTFSNPRVTEMFRAANALSTMEYRMMTNQDPFFEFMAMDNIGHTDPQKVVNATALIQLQLEKSKYKTNLLNALTMKNVFGTVIVEEPIEVAKLSHLGRKLPMLGFKPRSLLQMAFDNSVSDIADGSWIATSDIVTKFWLEQQKKDEEGIGGWINSELNKALAEDVGDVEIDTYVKQRLQAAGYSSDSMPETVREMITYHGKLDCKNDGAEYVVGVVNRKYLVKFADNPVQTGKRPFRIAHFQKWELEPLGYGLGKLFGALHKTMDSNRQKAQDITTFSAYSMMLRDRMAGINDKDMIIKPYGIIDTDDINALKPLKPNVEALPQLFTLENILQEEFRAASGATSTLQAIITEATASEVSLAQNEAVRNISVKAEIAAESLIREHIEQMHTHNMLFIKEPIKILADNEDGDKSPIDIYPTDLLLDLEVRLKIITDKDFKPERLKKLIEAYTVMSSIRNNNPDMAGISLKPVVEEIMKALDVPVNRVMVGLTQERVQEIQIANELFNPNVANVPQEVAAEQAGVNTVQTPVGEVLASENQGVE